MSAPVAQWPVSQPLVAGDDWTCIVTFPDTYDVTVPTWRAVVRDYPEGPEVVEFLVTPEAAPDNRLVLTLAAADTEKLLPGCGFDLATTAPTERTIFTVERIWLIASYSRA